jgi:hypothetical protein
VTTVVGGVLTAPCPLGGRAQIDPAGGGGARDGA